MDLINHRQAIEALRAVVAEAGLDYVYEKPNGNDCFYTWDGKPSCGVGRALHRLGVPMHVLHLWENSNAYSLCDNDPDEMRPALTTPLGARVFQFFQSRQDDGKTWSDALTAAEYEYNSCPEVAA